MKTALTPKSRLRGDRGPSLPSGAPPGTTDSPMATRRRDVSQDPGGIGGINVHDTSADEKHPI